MAFVTRRVQKIGVLGITPEERMETIMRRYIAPILIALVAAAPGAAFAASAVTPAAKPAVTAPADQTISGMVKAFDLKAHTLTLADGKTYQLPATFKDPGLKAGEKVTVHWKMNGTAYEATSVTIG
ncbi:DUF1344 domain-containing protein [Devosia sp. SD17-2]|jgi:hypothetical protein|uniref:DUF1344 domain-containing protein n=1 Tax=Devosia sp. SD17-2 TaxID=2976459 RepID=UPI0023D84366|nr:DUF1344 domain-containing protein [Devosia sp. SD17-2]WEJ34885.1 DUF1344 domain-containing protein [Devosia sp. SD17-2]